MDGAVHQHYREQADNKLTSKDKELLNTTKRSFFSEALRFTLYRLNRKSANKEKNYLAWYKLVLVNF